MPRGIVLPGVLQVQCPVCRAREGRECTNARGYLLELGSHRQRRAAWLEQERREARTPSR